eukprot:SAG22_NODE_9331_length_595_cov_3.997984_1_plen_28_part_01
MYLHLNLSFVVNEYTFKISVLSSLVKTS